MYSRVYPSCWLLEAVVGAALALAGILSAAGHRSVESTVGVSQKWFHGNFRAELPRNLG